MGRDEPKRRRAHLFAVIEKMTREGSQGETTSPTRASVERFVRLAGLSRASGYRWLEPKLTLRDDTQVRDLIQRLALRNRHDGYRRISH